MSSFWLLHLYSKVLLHLISPLSTGARTARRRITKNQSAPEEVSVNNIATPSPEGEFFRSVVRSLPPSGRNHPLSIYLHGGAEIHSVINVTAANRLPAE